MTEVTLYWSNICILNRIELEYLERIKTELRKEEIELRITHFGLGYSSHMSDYLRREDSILADIFLSADLEVFEDERIFSRFEDDLVDISGMMDVKNRSIMRGKLLPYLAIPLVLYSRERGEKSLLSLSSDDTFTFGGIDNSAAKTVVKTIWNLYGREKAEEALKRAAVTPMPINAFQRVKTGESRYALVPAVFALSDPSAQTSLPLEGSVLIPSYAAVRRTIAPAAAEKVIRALFSPSFLDMYEERGKMLISTREIPQWFTSLGGRTVLPSEEFLASLKGEDFYALYNGALNL